MPDAVAFHRNAVQRLQIQLHRALMLLIGARCVCRDVGYRIACLDKLVVDQVAFDFLAADVGQHLSVDLDTWRKRLATLGFHFPAKRRVLNDVLLCVRQIVFGENSADTSAPATIGL